MEHTVKFSLFGAILVLAGCGGPFTDVTKTSAGFDQPTNPNNVEILYLPPAPGTYQEVGAIVTEGWYVHDIAKMHNAIRDKAAGAGATAVVLQQQYFTGDFWGNRFLGYYGVAIKKTTK
jgi:hypothetical protein